MALLSAVIATVLLTTLGLAVALLGVEEMTLASHARIARSLGAASRAAVHLALADLRPAASWDPLLAAGTVPQLSAAASRFAGGSLTPGAPWNGVPLDLRAMTDRLQAATDASRGPGEGPQVWRLYAHGRLDDLVPGAAVAPWYLAVWIADDRADTDGDPLRDANGIVTLRAAALGPDGAVAAIDAFAARTSDGGGGTRVVLLSVRPAT
jgi:hypothetical protein